MRAITLEELNPMTSTQIIAKCASAFRHESPDERRKMTVATVADMELRGVITLRVADNAYASLARVKSQSQRR